MKKFLDSNSRRKVDILIMLNKEHGVTFDDLSQRLNASRPTIMRDLEEIKEKFDEWQVTEATVITRKTTAYLVAKAKFSLHQILLHYLNESLQYQAMIEIFHSESIHLRQFSETHFVSYNTLYKKLYGLNEVLAQFDLRFVTNKKASISGNEQHLRFFYSEFFWYAYSGTTWPFLTVSQRVVNFLIKPIEYIRGRKLSLVEKEKLSYDLAIILTRIKQGHLVSPTILKHEILQDSWHFKYLLNFLHPACSLFFRNLTCEQMKAEIAYAYIFVFAQEYHLTDNKNISDMLFYCQTHELKTAEVTNQWFRLFYQEFPVKISAKNYGLLYANLIHKHIKALTFQGAGTLSGIDISASVFLSPEMDQRVEFIVNQLTNKNKILRKNQAFLLDNYRFLISQYIEQERKPISICILSVFGEEGLEMIKRRAFQGIDMDVTVTGTITPQTDLVIMDREYEQVSFDQEKILYWENIPSKKSIFRVHYFINEHFGYG
jgi:hypothetical protein